MALALTRQKLPTLPGTDTGARDGVARGGYVLREADGGTPQLIMLATGSELQLAFAAAETLEAEGIPTRVVSLPCWEAFEAQDQAYRDTVLPPSVRRRVSIEMGVSMGWERWVGDEGAIIGLDQFGASAPAGTILERFGFTSERVTEVARRVVRDGLRGRIPTLGGVHGGLSGSVAARPSLRSGGLPSLRGDSQVVPIKRNDRSDGPSGLGRARGSPGHAWFTGARVVTGDTRFNGGRGSTGRRSPTAPAVQRRLSAPSSSSLSAMGRPTCVPASQAVIGPWARGSMP